MSAAAVRNIVLDHCRIAATDTHEELVQCGGLYARLAALQFNVDDRPEQEGDEIAAQ